MPISNAILSHTITQHITIIKSEQNIIDNLGENIVLDNTDIIELYIHKYYEKLYKEEPFNESEKNIFLNYITDKLSIVQRGKNNRFGVFSHIAAILDFFCICFIEFRF